MEGGTQLAGSLHQLQMFEEQAHEQLKSMQEEDKEKDELQKLKNKINKLKSKKKKLQSLLNKTSPLLLFQGVDISQSSEKDLKLLSLAVEDAQLRKMEEMLVAYRLTGITVKHINNNQLCICWDTSYKGEFYTSYYAELESDQDQIKLGHHSLPYFLPLDDICAKYLNASDMRQFATIVQEYLNAHTARQQEVVLTQEHFNKNIRGEILSTHAADFIQFQLKLNGEHKIVLDINLTYEHLCDVFPSKVHINTTEDTDTSLDEDTVRRISTYKDILKTNTLSAAFELMLAQ